MAPDDQKTKTVEISQETEDEARALLSVLRRELGTFETFVARRFDELSVEINATSQQMGLVEDGMAGRFGEIIGVLSSISHHGEGMTAANTGEELDTVIKTTEEAANTIIDASEKIASSLQQDIDWGDEQERERLLDGINDNLQDILLACSFQDLAGQRINKALSNLREVEDKLNNTLQGLGIDVDEAGISSGSTNTGTGAKEQPASQDDIDALFG